MAQPKTESNTALDTLMAHASHLLAQGLTVGLVGMDEPTAEWVEMQRIVSAQARGGERVMITGGGNGSPFTQTRRAWTTHDELSRIVKQNKAVDPNAGGGSGPRGAFNPSTGAWD
jgi:hypothetical protein